MATYFSESLTPFVKETLLASNFARYLSEHVNVPEETIKQLVLDFDIGRSIAKQNVLLAKKAAVQKKNVRVDVYPNNEKTYFVCGEIIRYIEWFEEQGAQFDSFTKIPGHKTIYIFPKEKKNELLQKFHCTFYNKKPQPTKKTLDWYIKNKIPIVKIKTTNGKSKMLAKVAVFFNGVYDNDGFVFEETIIDRVMDALKNNGVEFGVFDDFSN